MKIKKVFRIMRKIGLRTCLYRTSYNESDEEKSLFRKNFHVDLQMYGQKNEMIWYAMVGHLF